MAICFRRSGEQTASMNGGRHDSRIDCSTVHQGPHAPWQARPH
jgi:hypothetical protein